MEQLTELGFVQSLQDFWAQVENVLSTGFLGQPIGRGVLALVILLVAFFARGLIAKLIVATLGKLAGETETQFDDKLVEALKPPISLLPVAAGIFFAAQAMGAEGDVDSFFISFTQSVIIFAIFWALYRLVKPLLKLAGRVQQVLGETFIGWVSRILQGVIVFIGGAAILNVWGIPVIPFLASLSLLSVAVALGAQDLFKNLIAGMTIIAEQRLAKGDWVFVDGVVEGTVEDVGFRSTTVRRFDKAPVYVPNAKLADNPLVNFSRMTHRRIYWKIGLEYRTDSETLNKIRGAIADYIEKTDDFAPASDVSTFVHIDEFGDSAVNLMVYCFTKTTTWGEWLAIKEQLAFFIKKTVEEHEASFAFPSRSLYFEKLPDGFAPETFSPPDEDEDDADEDDTEVPSKNRSKSVKGSAKGRGRSTKGPQPKGRAVDGDGGDKGTEAGDGEEGE
ncbi:MAG TPA: mechanosensitive ion channel family protein [Henriciella marina]|uniref:mechanosensitive ion channel family protein n=1 Tax=Henriciella sp. TaxID=1968823 RepID=UPI0017CD1571|nr:mechanosensitive ion channel family protein [Henriciella sp.]HIG23163.1 mechanosensitive ion channel family protein [Henriciella sp.]HIK64888.1 mechanosensitive ion channel family protein [Henriciella marina]